LTATTPKRVMKRSKKHRHSCGAATSPTVGLPADLVVEVTGLGTVTSQPAGISCEATNSPCSASFAPGTVTLRAAAPSGTTFTGWGGDCTGTASTCAVPMSQDRNVTATFSTPPPPQTRIIEVRVDGPGRVTAPQINCSGQGGDCVGEYPLDDTVTLTAIPNNQLQQFDGWSNGCEGTSTTCTLTMNRDYLVEADFSSLLPLPEQIEELIESLLRLLGLG
jgi:uncharacterized repeat protein (TIGR02543 family)